jgi:polyisoprenoid-binding protein YceI
MKKITSVIVSFLLMCVAANAAETWKVDPQHSRIAFTTGHLGISDITGVFRDYVVTISASQPDFSDAVFDLAIETTSLDTGVQKRDGHLRSADFFDVEKYPRITFRSSKVQSAGQNRYTLSGDLTIHGQTRPITAELWYRGTTQNQDNVTAGFQLTATLRRSDFGVGPKFQPPMISDEVQIKADGEFIKQGG